MLLTSSSPSLHLQTVHTSAPWRSPMPLVNEPKSMAAVDSTTNPMILSPYTDKMADRSNSGGSKEKKWSIGGLFRRKKKTADCPSSSEEDYAENESPSKRVGKGGKDSIKASVRRPTKAGGFDHIVQSPVDANNRTLDYCHGLQCPTNTGSLDRLRQRAFAHNQNVISPKGYSGSEHDAFMIRSSNSDSMSRFRSDDSLMINQSSAVNRKTRAARTERYLKRRSRDGEGPIPLQLDDQPLYQNQECNARWKTQPVMLHGSSQSMMSQPIYYPISQTDNDSLQNCSSLTNVPINRMPQWNISSSVHNDAYKKMNPNRRSFSYDNYINKFTFPRNQTNITTPPPPPPPRDPMRRLTVGGNGMNAVESRPVSYAFDKQLPNESNWLSPNQRCVSDHHLGNQYQKPEAEYQHNDNDASSYFYGREYNQTSPMEPHVQNTADTSTQHAYKYVADATPRSRKPIHILEDHIKSTSDLDVPDCTEPRIKPRSATDFWRKIDREMNNNKPNQEEIIRPKVLKSKPMFNPHKHDELKSNSLSRSYRYDVPEPMSCEQVLNNSQVSNVSCHFKPVNKYEEHIAKNMATKNMRNSAVVSPQQTKPLKISLVSPKRETEKGEFLKKVTNIEKTKKLEEAINELEAIYKNLKLSDEDLLDRAERRDIPTPTGFSSKVKNYKYDDDDDDEDDHEGSSKREPDILLDDVAYRNLKYANKFPRVTDTQPPFGIPVGPIPAPAAQDYLKVTSISSNASTTSLSPTADRSKMRTNQNSPDIVADDLAVRSLRKDNGSFLKLDHLNKPNLNNKKKVFRSQSADIYNLIQRDASRPSGGCLDDYNIFDKLSQRLLKLTDDDCASDQIPTTIFDLKKDMKPREARHKTVNNFLHPSKTSGAVFNLPSTLQQKPPIPTPRKSLSPYLNDNTSADGESIDILNKLVLDARLTSERLSQDLVELRKESKATKEPAKKSYDVEKGTFIDTTKIELPQPNLTSSKMGTEPELKTIKYEPIPSLIETPKVVCIEPRLSPLCSQTDNSLVAVKEAKVFSPKIVSKPENNNELKPSPNAVALSRQDTTMCGSKSIASVPQVVTTSLKSTVDASSKNDSIYELSIDLPKKKSLSSKTMLLNEINEASKTVRACEQMLVDVVQDTPKNMLKDKQLLDDINEVSLAVRGCEKVLRDVIPCVESCIEETGATERTLSSGSGTIDKDSNPELRKSEIMIPVVEKSRIDLEKEHEQIAKITSDCLTQIAVIEKDTGDYDNLHEKNPLLSNEKTHPKITEFHESERIVLKQFECKPDIQKEIDEMMKACSEVTETERLTVKQQFEAERASSVDKTPPFSTPVDDFICPVETSDNTPTNNASNSSGVPTPLTSNEIVPAPNVDQEMKSTSKSLCEVIPATGSPKSTLSLAGHLESTLSVGSDRKCSPVTLLDGLSKTNDATATKTEATTESSQYNSSEELAMIFGIRQASVTPPTGNQMSYNEWNALETSVDEFELDSNNNDLTTSNNNNSNNSHDIIKSLFVMKAAAPKTVLTHFGTKKNELDIIFENPEEYIDTENDNKTDDGNIMFGIDGGKELNCETFINNNYSSSEDDDDDVVDSQKTFKSELHYDVGKQYTNELSIDVIDSATTKLGNSSDGGSDQFPNQAIKSENFASEKRHDEGNVIGKRVTKTSTAKDHPDFDRMSRPSTSSAEAVNEVERSDGDTFANPALSRSVNVFRNRDSAEKRNDVGEQKVRRNLIHPEHFVLASLTYDGLSSNYDEVLTLLAVLIAIITLIALIFI